MIDQFINFVIRPPRAEYNPDQYLWEKDFTLATRKYSRLDIELTNLRGHTLQCSHYVPSPLPEDSPLPCVIYCHGNSGCRADANEAAVILLPLNITVFTLDFSGSGLSDGEYVSLGCHEKDDLKVAVSYLRSNSQISCIGLWGRSMGAVTSLLYGAEDPSVAGMVLDSAFANLFDLMMELVDVYKIRLPKFTVKVGLQYMRRVIQKKAKFDIMDLNCKQVAPKTFIPALFGHANGDKFVQSHHSDLIFKAYAVLLFLLTVPKTCSSLKLNSLHEIIASDFVQGDKNIIKFDGDHNSSRPQFFYDSISIFFYSVLRPPRVSSVYSSKLERYYDLGGLKVGAGVDENLLYEIIDGLRVMEPHEASTSSAPPDILTATSISELLSVVAPVTTDLMANNNLLNDEIPPDLQVKSVNQDDDCCSFTSSNRESWGRCSSLGSNDELTSDCTAANSSSHEATTKVLAMPDADTSQSKSTNMLQDDSTKKKAPADSKKPKRDKLEKLEALSQRLRLCILRRVNPRRHSS